MQEQLANIMKTGRYKLIEFQKLQLHGNRASINEAYSTILLGCLAFVCNQGCPLGIFTWLRNHNQREHDNSYRHAAPAVGVLSASVEYADVTAPAAVGKQPCSFMLLHEYITRRIRSESFFIVIAGRRHTANCFKCYI